MPIAQARGLAVDDPDPTARFDQRADGQAATRIDDGVRLLAHAAPVPGYILRQTEHAYVAKGQLIGNIGTLLARAS